MSKVVVINNMTLDGVIQGPGRPDEDTRGGFDRGGWSAAHMDPALSEAVGARLREGSRYLFGRRTYEDVLAHWNSVDGPIGPALNAAEKHVASTTLREPLRWPNSHLLVGDAVEAVTELKRQPAGDLHVMGSGVLIQTLLRHGLVDELLLMVHPVVLGGGRRLFPDGGVPADLRLADCTPAATGVLIATYRAA